MTDREILAYGLDALASVGAHHGQCRLERAEKHEMNVESGNLNLIRTVFDAGFHVTALRDNRKASIRINKLGREPIQGAVAEVVAMADSAQEDPANAIPEKQGPHVSQIGDEQPDLELMYQRLDAFLRQVRTEFPKTNIENTYLSFERTHCLVGNTNGSDLEESKGYYKCDVVFTSKDGARSSSFNYTSFSSRDLGRDILECGSLRMLLKQSSEQIETKQIPGKFAGDIIVTPDCMQDVVGFLADVYLRDGAMIAGTSVYKNKLGQQVADSGLTLHSRPVSSEIVDGYAITNDGFVAGNTTIIDQGTLDSFLLSLYGANKTGRQRAANHGGCYVIEPGDCAFDDLIKGVKQGVLLARFSGGYPSQNGDFSGVAKNSYYIEDGKVQYPISETMVSGNLTEMLIHIGGISRERIHFGHCILPWVCFGGVTVS